MSGKLLVDIIKPIDATYYDLKGNVRDTATDRVFLPDITDYYTVEKNINSDLKIGFPNAKPSDYAVFHTTLIEKPKKDDYDYHADIDTSFSEETLNHHWNHMDYDSFSACDTMLSLPRDLKNIDQYFMQKTFEYSKWAYSKYSIPEIYNSTILNAAKDQWNRFKLKTTSHFYYPNEGIRPRINLNMDSDFVDTFELVEDLNRESEDLKKSRKTYTNPYGKLQVYSYDKSLWAKWAGRMQHMTYGLLQLGEYPQSVCSTEESKVLNQKLQANKLTQIDQYFYGSSNNKDFCESYHHDGTPRIFNTYITDQVYQDENGNKFVKTRINPFSQSKIYPNGKSRNWTKTFEKDQHKWVKVEPINWIIMNWNDMPTSINPEGNGTAQEIQLITQDCIIGGVTMHNMINNNVWSTSTLREFLNENFLKSALMPEHNGYYYNPFYYYSYGSIFKFNDKVKTNDEMLKDLIQSGTSVFLHGPSGVGKSTRVKELDPTATRITLRPMMNPEEVDGVLNRETGDYIPPLWYTQLKEKCEKEPDRKHILFIDELTNVRPTVQSLVYSIVLDRAGKDGLWPLPENAVVVAAGNETQDNLAAHPLTNALYRRFCHLYYEIDKKDWLQWVKRANQPDYETTDRTIKVENNTESNQYQLKLHPAILNYIYTTYEDDNTILYKDLNEDDPEIVTDPRKWEIASKILYKTNNLSSIIPAVGKEVYDSIRFSTKKSSIAPDNVVKNQYIPGQLQKKVQEEQEKLKDPDNKNKQNNEYLDIVVTTVTGLCSADETQVEQVRQFIYDELDPKALHLFDSIWGNNDPNRIAVLRNCKLTKNPENQDDIYKNGIVADTVGYFENQTTMKIDDKTSVDIDKFINFIEFVQNPIQKNMEIESQGFENNNLINFDNTQDFKTQFSDNEMEG